MTHSPVLFQEVMDALQPRAGGRYLDVTAGGGGHAVGVLERSGPDGRLMGTDADPQAVERVTERLRPFGGRAVVARGWIDDAAAMAATAGMTPLDGILADLGLSSYQLAEAERGFAFMREGPLDMRFSAGEGHEPTAAHLVNRAELDELVGWLRAYGEIENPRRVAEAILGARPITTTTQLRDIVAGVARSGRRQRIHPATLVFQALRIVVNDELGRLQRALPDLIAALAPGGRLAVITFHSLEDRMVKVAFREAAIERTAIPGFGSDQVEQAAAVTLVTHKPIEPTEAEIEANPRARSAHLRVVEKR
ncbi:MAG TPA: 16S rRNA (cytosine(1402)-N(4))-methyltransferase RsmH [Thermoflexales bacterium]|nr:16S rRNA (cytosine(1402)-N(4))-methyltransferase RsmH [Thermoflexales bacterium]HQX08786.1 16S rRNA (cytosine(1402)-N(4))-methyltransferase RsmH [Thermoflexales bacterium]HQZ52000.1 16S rRNA (cytosine(1402)-N(4))-methyltransferase RsmH [Thermoflexales bacterium]HRA52169.1 16S rRNA (cytosine(1402)-N(4))-methyltransferase RsmH [Thermoflexales bacterium]